LDAEFADLDLHISDNPNVMISDFT